MAGIGTCALSGVSRFKFGSFMVLVSMCICVLVRLVAVDEVEVIFTGSLILNVVSARVTAVVEDRRCSLTFTATIVGESVI